MDLLWITDGTKGHYVLIKDFNRFMYNKTKHEGRKYFCRRCFNHFSSEEKLGDHKGNCLAGNGTQV